MVYIRTVWICQNFLLTKNKTGSVVNFPEATSVGENILSQDVDVLVLAALENSVTGENANQIKAKLIIELANGPITQEGDEVLARNGQWLCQIFCQCWW